MLSTSVPNAARYHGIDVGDRCNGDKIIPVTVLIRMAHPNCQTIAQNTCHLGPWDRWRPEQRGRGSRYPTTGTVASKRLNYCVICSKRPSPDPLRTIWRVASVWPSIPALSKRMPTSRTRYPRKNGPPQASILLMRHVRCVSTWTLWMTQQS